MARSVTSIKVEGGLLPADFLRKLGGGDEGSIPGLTAASYHLDGTRLHDAISASWNALRSRWVAFFAALEKLPESDHATSLTRERFLLPLFSELQYGRLVAVKAREIEGKEYAISHHWANSPIQLLGANVPLDRRTFGVAGASRTSPHGMVQDYLNRTPETLWGFLSNGRLLRVLRDSKSLARASFIEFDLTTMFESEVYSDFVILWLLCHQSRVEADDPHKCHLEKWMELAHQQGTRALDKLRYGVAKALIDLGQGFLEDPANKRLRELLTSERLSTVEYYKQVIRVIYRLMFLFAGEDRDLLFPPDCDPAAKENYLKFYSVSRLRDMVAKVLGTRHGDLWSGLKTVFSKLSVEGCPPLALPALDSFLWEPAATFALNEAELSNVRLLSAVRNLAYITEGSARQKVDYRNIGAEEIGGIYENIISLSPILDIENFTFILGEGAFSERDETASHYTPTSLVDELLNSALNPVLDRACEGKDPAKAILALKVCDRACGSGHFLVAAAKRMAKRLASIRTDEAEPSPEHIQEALRDVIAHSIYGVDSNPTAVELCKFSLWLESMAHGRPLSFLENRIKCGNSLLGATPAAIARGIPDEAFDVLSGDDKAVVSALKKRNKKEREELEQGQQSLFGKVIWVGWVNIREGAEKIIAIDDDEIEHIHKKQAEYERLLVSDSYQNQKLIADTWCAAFVLPRIKGAPAITAATFEEIKNDPGSCPETLRQEIERLADEYEFFHWHIEFPEVYALPKEGEKPENSLCGWNGGFDINLGNPPWDRVKLQEKEWFAERAPEIANVANAAERKKLIEALKDVQPYLFAQFEHALRKASGESHILRDSGLFPLCGRGDINLYAVFAEGMRNSTNLHGRSGFVVPSGIVTDESTKDFFSAMVDSERLVSVYDFENREGIFPGIGHGRMKFALITVGEASTARFGFQLWNIRDLSEPDRVFELTRTEIELFNPNTHTCPVFRTRREAEISRSIYLRVPVLVREGAKQENQWGISFYRMFDMTNDAKLFLDSAALNQREFKLNGNVYSHPAHGQYLPLYEAKMASHFDHRFGTFKGRAKEREATALDRPSEQDHRDPHFSILPRYWVAEKDVPQFSWRLTFRDISHATNDRSFIAQIIPRSAVGNSLICVQTQFQSLEPILYGALCSFVFDFIARQKMGGLHLNFFVVKQLPTYGPDFYNQACAWGSGTLKTWLLPRILELTYTAFDLAEFAKDCHYEGSPFMWTERRRFLLRCELDAAFFHLYMGIPEEWQKGPESLTDLFPTARSAVEYIMETFPIVKRQDVKTHGRYRTKETILEIYDAMAHAMTTGKPYQTLLDPPAADSSLAHV